MLVIKAEKMVDQSAVRLFDGNTKPKIIKFDSTVGCIVKKGKTRVNTYKTTVVITKVRKVRPIPLSWNESKLRTGLKNRYSNERARATNKKDESPPKKKPLITNWATRKDITVKINALRTGFIR